MRASIKRDGPGEWWWTVGDEEGAIVGGIAPDWPRALDDAQRELQVLGQVDDVLPPAAERYPFSVLGSARLTRHDVDVTPVAFRGNLASDRRPAWRKWLGLP